MHSAALDATNTVDLLKSVNFTGYKPANSVVYPNSSFGRALESVAVLIKADVGIEAAQVDIGGWDTHSAQDPLAGSMFKTMQDFSNSLAAFYADVIATRLQRDGGRVLGVRPQRARERQQRHRPRSRVGAVRDGQGHRRRPRAHEELAGAGDARISRRVRISR